MADVRFISFWPEDQPREHDEYTGQGETPFDNKWIYGHDWKPLWLDPDIQEGHSREH